MILGGGGFPLLSLENFFGFGLGGWMGDPRSHHQQHNILLFAPPPTSEPSEGDFDILEFFFFLPRFGLS